MPQSVRKLYDGSVFFPDQRMEPHGKSLKSYTLNYAYAAFEVGVLGSLKSGKLDDVTVVSKDFLTIQEDDILAAKVWTTPLWAAR